MNRLPDPYSRIIIAKAARMIDFQPPFDNECRGGESDRSCSTILETNR
jgi:hypothetical protein